MSLDELLTIDVNWLIHKKHVYNLQKNSQTNSLFQSRIQERAFRRKINLPLSATYLTSSDTYCQIKMVAVES